jgi:excisionase family DNA binding protein
MSLKKQLQEIVAGMPEGGSVTLPVAWLQGLLEEAEHEGDVPDELLTLEAVAERVGRAESTVRTWCNSGKLEGAFRLCGRDWRIPESALRSFLEGQVKGDDAAESPGAHGEADLGSWRRIRGLKPKGRAA